MKARGQRSRSRKNTGFLAQPDRQPLRSPRLVGRHRRDRNGCRECPPAQGRNDHAGRVGGNALGCEPQLPKSGQSRCFGFRSRNSTPESGLPRLWPGPSDSRCGVMVPNPRHQMPLWRIPSTRMRCRGFPPLATRPPPAGIRFRHSVRLGPLPRICGSRGKSGLA